MSVCTALHRLCQLDGESCSHVCHSFVDLYTKEVYQEANNCKCCDWCIWYNPAREQLLMFDVWEIHVCWASD